MVEVARDAEPHRGAEDILRPVPPGREARKAAASDEGLEAVFRSVFPIKDFCREFPARIRRLPLRRAEIRRRGVPAALHDLCGAAQGDAAAHRVRCGPGNRRQVGQGHQGAGCLYGRHPVHDRERHLRHQRHRARDRLADAPLAGRLLRPRQGQDAFERQAAVRRARDSVSRLVARFRIRRQGHHACPHRPSPQAAGDDAALCARPDAGRHPEEFLLQDRVQAHQGRRLDHAGRAELDAERQGDADWKNAKTGEVLAEAGTKITVRGLRKWQEDGVQAVSRAADELIGRYSALDMVNPGDGRDLCRSGR